ncbi:NACHT domain-containing protein [Streptomyces sp. 8K308]|uniref:NACHT domain-containing protein n=1 Tax=Streptomyces sp. 8K308 TaxID=2530388 RepID=UPI0010503B9D|nr:NACHT domain-containing protein [Streptomyces sp. 8K308]TDC12454.1 NACHT domain-containing protein [Streptomyces sp. 8K308]
MVWAKKDAGVSGTGDASTEGGGIANTGVLNINRLVLQQAAGPEGLNPQEIRAALAHYARRVREAYGRLDLEVLTPMSDQGEQQTIGLREVFVAPLVREGMPPVTLPRELVQRLADRGEFLDPAGVLPGVDGAQVERAQAMSERPVGPVLEVLADRQHERVVLLGDPGAGKSTLGRYLVLKLAQDAAGDVPAALRDRLPLMVELRRCAEPRWQDATFEDFLDHLHSTEGMSVPPAVLRSLLARGQVVVVFDGLDELFDPKMRKLAAHRIAAFATRYPGTRVVVTSRIVGYQPSVLDAAGFTHYTLQDLTEEQIAEFARLWYRTACPEDGQLAGILVRRVTDAVANSRSVRELAGNPMLLTILAIIGRRQTLPRDRRGVYEHAVTVLIAHWDQDSKHLKPAGHPEVRDALECLEARDLLELLRLLARHMQAGEGGIARNLIDTDELESIIRDFLTDFEFPPMQARTAARAMVNRLRDRNFILSNFGSGAYGFVHRTFLEYLAASDITHRYQSEREWTREELVRAVLGRRASDPAWHEVLLLVTGQLNPTDAASLIGHLLELYRASRDDALLALAIRALAEIRKIGTSAMVRCSQNVIDALIWQLTRWPWAASRLSSAQPAVATFGDYWAGRPRLLRWFHLYGQFSSGDTVGGERDLHRFVFSFYRAPGTPTVLAAHSPNPEVRESALDNSPRTWPEEIRDELHRLFLDRATNDPEPRLRGRALRLLAEYWPEETRALFLDRARNDPERYLRDAALRCWPGTGRRRPVPSSSTVPRTTPSRTCVAGRCAC